MKKSVLLVAVIAMLCSLSLTVYGQKGPGYIIRQAGTTALNGTGNAFPSATTTITGKDILNPDYASSATQSDFATTTPYTGVWTASNDETGSEIPYAAVPPYSSEPYSDLRRGPGHLYSDYVPGPNASNSNASYYMYYRSVLNSEALCFRLRMGSIMPGAKGYSILIDADGKFGATGPNADPNYVAATTGTNGNSGFELEVDLYTQTSGQTGIALYNVDGTSSPSLVWSANDYTQFSQEVIAGTNDNGDPDFYLDFFIPWNKITGISSLGITTSTTLRFIPTTVMAPLPAIGGPKSDIYGLNDALYPDPNVEYETLMSAMPGFTINQLSSTAAGAVPNSGNNRLCTAAPVITSATIGTTNGSVSGTWSNLSISSVTSATIYLYKNGSTTSFANAIANKNINGGNWVATNLLISSGDVITAIAQGSGENMCLTSNSYKASNCTAANTPPAPVLCSTTQQLKGTGGSNIASGYTVNIQNVSRGTAVESATFNNTTVTSGNFGFTANSSTWTWYGGCSGGANIVSGSYRIWYQDNATGCTSNYTYYCASGNNTADKILAATVPTVTTPSGGVTSITTSTKKISGAADANSTVSLWVNRVLVDTVKASSTGTYTFPSGTSGLSMATGLNFNSGDSIYLVSQLNQGSASSLNNSTCAAFSAGAIVSCYVAAPVITTDANSQLIAGKVIYGTSSEAAGTSIKVYVTTSGTPVATATVSSTGTWNTGSYTAASGSSYYATATNTTCGVTATSSTYATVSSTNISRCGTITGTTPSTSPMQITTAATAVSGTLSSSATTTTVRLYQNNVFVGEQTGLVNTTSWGIIAIPSGSLANGDTLTISVKEGTLGEFSCPTKYVVTCTLSSTATLSFKNCTSGCTEATVKSGDKLTYTITGAASNNFYSLRDSATGKSLSTGIWASSASFDIITDALTQAGSYKVQLINSSVSSTEVCSVPSLARSYIVLPITLLDFYGTKAGNTNLLTWKTAQEINASRFEVERSTDGITFTAIGTVSTTGSNTSYTYTDNQPQAINYYRLKLVDRDGQFKYSKVILLRDNGNSIVLNAVRPNPFENEVKVSLFLAQPQKVNLVLMDASGRKVQQKNVSASKGTNDIILSGLASLPRGIYVLRVNCDGALFQEKLVKVN